MNRYVRSPFRLLLGAVLGALPCVALQSAEPAYSSSERPFGALVAEDASASAEAEEIQNRLAERSRVIRGVPVKRGKYEWIVALGRFNGTTFVQHCGGTIVGMKWVLTAAHCPVSDIVAVVADDVDLYKARKPSALVKRVFAGPYNKRTHSADYALLLLDRDLGIEGIPRNRDEQLEVETGTELIIAGWGRADPEGPSSEVLLEGVVKTVDFNDCFGSYDLRGLSVTKSMFCAAATKHDACYGDSGGPVFREVSERPRKYEFMGIVSWGVDCGHHTYPGVYTRSSAIAKWVDETMRDCAAEANPPGAVAGRSPCKA